MLIFRKECGYCKTKINKEEEVFRNVKDPVFIDKRQKAFCCSEHADSYEKEIKEYVMKEVFHLVAEYCPHCGEVKKKNSLL